MGQIKNLLLLPGLLCDIELWGAQIEALSGSIETTVADMTGHVDMRQLAGLILESAPREFALAGFSMGGYCALEIYRQAPERVQKLALIDTSARADTKQQTDHREALIDLCRAGNMNQVLDHLLPVFVNQVHLADQSLVDNIRAMAARIGCKAFVSEQKAIMSRDDKRAMLKNITCDTLVLCGAQDQLTLPEFHAELAELIPRSRLVIVDDSGHFSPMEQPERVTVEMKYWLLD
jgi:pimeloyl-ACP methyl ester carboxylesterase